ncbi:MAG: zinc ribbon domain-containing protein [Promethearchaeota archaeon]
MINKPIVRGDVVEILDVVYQESDPEDPVNHIMKLFPKAPRKRNLIGSMRMVVEKTLPSNRIVKVTQDTKVRVNSCIAILNNRGKIVSYEDPVSNIENDIEYRKVIEDLLSYTGRLEGRIRNIETEKKVLNLERQKLDYGKRILNDAIERLTNITGKLLESPLLSNARYGNLESMKEDGGISELRNLEDLSRNLTRLDRLVSDNSSEENSQNTEYCKYCGGEVEDNQVYCRHCGTRIN